MKFKSAQSVFSILAAAAFLFITAAVPASANDPDEPTKNLLETAAEAGEFTILTKALQATGLDAELKNGEYTIFAPSDAAFKNLPPGALENFMADKESLKRILLYHVVKGKKMAAEVTKLSEIETMQGSNAKIKVKSDKVKIDGARIVKTDLAATNGVIHMIDKVMTPSN